MTLAAVVAPSQVRGLKPRRILRRPLRSQSRVFAGAWIETPPGSRL